MRLAELIQVLSARVVGDAAVEVGAVRDDSRAVANGDVFVAVRGRRADGHAFVGAAVAAGAAALVVERPVDAAVPQVVVENAAEALGVLTARAAGRPAAQMALVGITGTNGKT